MLRRGQAFCGTRRFSQEKEFVPECAVAVACPLCPVHSPVSRGPGRIKRNMLGWTLEEKTDRSGVWLFRSALRGENLFCSLTQREIGSGRDRTAQRGRSLVSSSCSCSYAYGQGPAGRILVSDAGHCLSGCGRLSPP